MAANSGSTPSPLLSSATLVVVLLLSSRDNLQFTQAVFPIFNLLISIFSLSPAFLSSSSPSNHPTSPFVSRRQFSLMHHAFVRPRAKQSSLTLILRAD